MIPFITVEEQNSWSQNEVLKCSESSSIDIEMQCSAKYTQVHNFSPSVFLLFSFLLSFLLFPPPSYRYLYKNS